MSRIMNIIVPGITIRDSGVREFKILNKNAHFGIQNKYSEYPIFRASSNDRR